MKQKGFVLLPIIIVLALMGIVSIYYFRSKKASTLPRPTYTPSLSTTPSATPNEKVIATTKPISITPSPKPTATATSTKNYESLDLYPSQSGTIKRNVGYSQYATFSFTDNPNFQAIKYYGIITACFRIMSTSSIPGKNITYILLDNGSHLDKQDLLVENIATSGTELCHQVPQSKGNHVIELVINPDRTIKEANYSNNTVSFSYTLEGDTQAPTISVDGPFNYGGSLGTCFAPPIVNDNISLDSNIKIEHYMDDQFVPSQEHICVQGNKGDTHTYKIRATDEAGNTAEKVIPFSIF